jgi:SAM-dependent methyltransferase
MTESFEQTYFSGGALYGDDFDEARIRSWHQQEEHGYYALAQSYKKYVYAYRALNEYQSFRYLRSHYACCLAMGCAAGDDVAPLAPRVDRFIAIEPAEQWWSEQIQGTPAEYRKPSISGEIPMEDGAADLVVCLAVLHHVPNASRVLSELARVLRSGGQMVLREPISTMGDWRKPRRGLTPNERGFPPHWFDAQIPSLGLRVVRRSHTNFPLIPRLARVLGMEPAYNHAGLVRLDAMASWLTRWNLHYHRDSIFKKFAPIDVAYILEKI